MMRTVACGEGHIVGNLYTILSTSKYNTCSTAHSASSFQMTHPTHPHNVPYTDQLLGAYTCSCMDIVYIYTYILEQKPAFGGLLCYGTPLTAFQRKCSDASVLSKALIMTQSWVTEVRACPWPQCDSASGQLRAKHA